MTRTEQNKILNDKIESNVNQYKVDRLNAEISAFSSGDLNKYEFLTRKDLKYKPNALDKARFEFSPLGQTFSTGLDKTDQDYQEEGVIKLLKDIRDSLSDNNKPNDDGTDDGNDDNRPNYDRNDASNTEYNNLLLECNRTREDLKKTKDKLNIIKDDANKKAEIEQKLLKAKDELEEKNNFIEDLKKSINDLEKMKEIINNYKQEIQYLKNELIKKRIDSKSKKRIDQAKSFKDQKGKGHVNLPIALSKTYTNNSSKELVSDIEQLINNLYNNKQITKLVYNILNKSII